MEPFAADVMEEDALPFGSERLFASLNIDAIHQIAALLPTSSLLAVTAVSQELGRTFCPAVSTLAESKVSLRAQPLQVAVPDGVTEGQVFQCQYTPLPQYTPPVATPLTQ